MENSQLYIQRKADQYLAEWKANPQRLSLIVKGSRQIGKTLSQRTRNTLQYLSSTNRFDLLVSDVK